MFGVPSDLDLSFLHGRELIQICIGQAQIQFHFHPAGSITVEGGWELLGVDGARLDQKFDGPERPPYQLHRLIARRVIGSEVLAPKWFALRFEGGELLRILDDTSEFESFQIQPGNIVV